MTGWYIKAQSTIKCSGTWVWYYTVSYTNVIRENCFIPKQQRIPFMLYSSRFFQLEKTDYFHSQDKVLLCCVAAKLPLTIFISSHLVLFCHPFATFLHTARLVTFRSLSENTRKWKSRRRTWVPFISVWRYLSYSVFHKRYVLYLYQDGQNFSSN